MGKVHERIKALNLTKEEIEREVQSAFDEIAEPEVQGAYDESIKNFEVGTIMDGKVIYVIGSDVVIAVGYKSEGIVDDSEFDGEGPEIGDEVTVMLEAVEDEAGTIVLSKRKADRQLNWQRIINEHVEGDTVTGRVTRKIKGGLLVDIGVPVFLPASQIDIRRPGDIAEYIGNEVTCKILKIDESRKNIVVSRRRLIEEEREKLKAELKERLEVGDNVKGVVKNIADFGAFVDLGGLDGLLHITDMSWGRVSHPSQVVKIDEEIEVRVLNIDKENDKIALGLKQLLPNPWDSIEDRYPIGQRVMGVVVNIMNYGAFVKLEDGVEGLVHISEMSWTRRLGHPSEMVAIGDEVEVVVLNINKEKQEISLGMKQTQVNPWTMVEEKYPPGTVIDGKVRNLTHYGAFVEIEEGIDGLLHVSDMSWTRKVSHPSEIVKKGDSIKCIVLSVDQAKRRVALGLKQLQEDPWQTTVLDKYHVGDIVDGKVTKLTTFGVFVALDEEVEGLLHISELSDQKVENPEDVVTEGEQLTCRIIRVDEKERKIGLSLRQLGDEYQPEMADQEAREAPAPRPSTPQPAESGMTEMARKLNEALSAREESGEVTEGPGEAESGEEGQSDSGEEGQPEES